MAKPKQTTAVAHSHDHHDDEHHVTPQKVYFIIFALLLLLVGATVGADDLHLGVMAVPVALAIAITKAVLIVMYFMHVKYSSKAVLIAAAAGFFWLIMLFALTFADYASRTWMPTPGV